MRPQAYEPCEPIIEIDTDNNEIERYEEEDGAKFFGISEHWSLKSIIRYSRLNHQTLLLLETFHQSYGDIAVSALSRLQHR
jgi:hypothetical protein